MTKTVTRVYVVETWTRDSRLISWTQAQFFFGVCGRNLTGLDSILILIEMN